MEQRRLHVRDGINLAGIIGLAICCIFMWKSGMLTSNQKMAEAVLQFGAMAPVAFAVFQAVQVVVPIMPGGVSCLAGVLIFGAWEGFLLNYIGICAGSVIAFLLSKKYGKPLLDKMFSEKLMKKYQSWTGEKNRFTKLFALAIFFPVAPDDFLCYLAGTTEMKLPVFTGIILLGKPASIALYSMALAGVFTRVTALIGG